MWYTLDLPSGDSLSLAPMPGTPTAHTPAYLVSLCDPNWCVNQCRAGYIGSPAQGPRFFAIKRTDAERIGTLTSHPDTHRFTV